MPKKTKGKYQLVKRLEPWPQWAHYMLGVAEGWHAFELKDEFDEFHAKWNEEHKNDKPMSFKIEEENKTTGKIGFQ